MATEKTAGRFTKSKVTNLWRYDPEGTYYLFARIGGKLKKKSLDTKVLSVAKLRLADRLRAERQQLELRGQVSAGKLTVCEASERLVSRLGNRGGKPRTAQFYQERINALFRCAPELKDRDCGRLSVAECQSWAAKYRTTVKPATYN